MTSSRRGYAMLYVLGISTIAFLLIAGALRMHYGLHQANQRELQRLQNKANTISLHITDLPPDPG